MACATNKPNPSGLRKGINMKDLFKYDYEIIEEHEQVCNEMPWDLMGISKEEFFADSESEVVIND